MRAHAPQLGLTNESAPRLVHALSSLTCTLIEKEGEGSLC